jgi:hypothetical protein
MVCLGDNEVQKFSAQAAAIIKTTKMRAFHGNDYKRRFDSAYREFLTLTRDTLASSIGSFASCLLLSGGWKIEYCQFCDRLIENSLTGSGIVDSNYVRIAQAISKPIFKFLFISNEYGKGGGAKLQIDQNSVTIQLGNAIEISDHKISAKLPMVAIANAYRLKLFSNASYIVKDGIDVVNDESSFLVQASDLIANYSTAYIYSELGKHSKTNDKKVAIFLDIFGKKMQFKDVKRSIKIVNEELELTESGEILLQVY